MNIFSTTQIPKVYLDDTVLQNQKQMNNWPKIQRTAINMP